MLLAAVRRASRSHGRPNRRLLTTRANPPGDEPGADGKHPTIHPTATVDPGARLSQDVAVGPIAWWAHM